MPKTLFQKIIFTLMMVLVMVYGMICYNIALVMGGMNTQIFLIALSEMPIMVPIAFAADFFLIGNIAEKKAFSIVDPKRDNPFFLVIMISVVSVIGMCPLMSLAATILFKHAGKEFVAVWLHTTALNLPMAFFLQLCYCGPLVRFLFRKIFREQEDKKG